MKGRLGYPGLLSYVHTMKQVMIAKITWVSGDETYYGTFNSYEDYRKWAEEAKKEDGDVIEDISFDWLFKVTEDLATAE